MKSKKLIMEIFNFLIKVLPSLTMALYIMGNGTQRSRNLAEVLNTGRMDPFMKDIGYRT